MVFWYKDCLVRLVICAKFIIFLLTLNMKRNKWGVILFVLLYFVYSMAGCALHCHNHQVIRVLGDCGVVARL